MDLELLGRHALLFDDDATAAFVNYDQALVEWNSLLIEWNYLDLPSPSEEQESDEGAKPAGAGVYNAVEFSYGNYDDSTDQKNSDAGLGDSGFCPPFPVPESLLQCLMIGAGMEFL